MKLFARARISGVCVFAGILTATSGCQFVGPSSIQAGRLNYNEVIQRTSKEQTFTNIVRVYNREPTSFVEVNQISATVQFQGVAMGGVTNIGLTQPGSANLSLQYQESPTIQYQPLSGAALIAQLGTPITIESLGNLFNSDWHLASILTLAVDRITPGFSDYYAAVNALIALDSVGAITLTPGVLTEEPSPKSDPSDKAKTASDASNKSTDKANYPILIISLQRRHPDNKGNFEESEVQQRIRALWCRLTSLLGGDAVACVTDRPLILYNYLLALPKSKKNLPTEGTAQIFTRSAYGVLKGAVEPPGEIAFVDERTYRKITSYPWNSENKLTKCDTTSFYTADPQINEDDSPDTVETKNEVRRILQSRAAGEDCLLTATYSSNADIRSVQLERQLSIQRKFVLIIKSDREIPNSYVSYFDGTQWYAIDKKDEISQRNFLLIGHLLTIQATATPPLSLVPTVTVGGK
jgi:hypothetical protein